MHFSLYHFDETKIQRQARNISVENSEIKPKGVAVLSAAYMVSQSTHKR